VCNEFYDGVLIDIIVVLFMHVLYVRQFGITNAHFAIGLLDACKDSLFSAEGAKGEQWLHRNCVNLR